MTTRLFWLSFCDVEKPAGEQFLGACLIPVAEQAAADVLPELDEQFPQHASGAEWIAAAMRAAHRLGCNPGGEVATWDITDAPIEYLAFYEVGRLYSKAEINAIDERIEAGVKDAETKPA